MNKHFVVIVSWVTFSGGQVFNKQHDRSKFMYLLFLVIANDMFKRKGKKGLTKGKKMFKIFMTSAFENSE